MSLVLKIAARVVRGRLLVEVDGEPPRVVGRIVRCPCCGAPQFVES